MEVKAEDVERLVVDQGSPETLTLGPADWRKVYVIYRQTNRDDKGVFIRVVNTRVYSSAPATKDVDLSDKVLWKDETPAEPGPAKG